MEKNYFSTKTLARIAILVALSVLLKSFLSIETQIFRATFYDIPLMILGITLGPAAGLAGGFIVDWLHVLFSPFAFSFNLFTASSIVWGLLPGLFLFKRRMTLRMLAITVIITSLIAFSLNTWQLYIWYGSGIVSALPARIITMVIKLPIQVYVVKVIVEALFQADFYTNEAQKEVYEK